MRNKGPENQGKFRSNVQRVTIIDLSRHLGISKSTVSRALNGYKDISESTRLRVQKAAQQLGYRPLAHAQAIKTGLARSVGLVLNVDTHNDHRPFLTDFLDGISQRASQESWTLTVATAPNSEAVLETIKRLSDERKVDGFILPRTRILDPRIVYLRQAHVPFVLYGRTEHQEDCAWFDINGEKAIAQAVARLAGFGHKRIAFINGVERYMYAQLREDGFRDGIRAAGLEVDEDLMLGGAIDKASGAQAGGTLLDLAVPPTAIVCALDRAALGVYEAAKARNLTIGRDVSVIAYDGIPEGEYATPPLTTFSVDSRQAGEALADLLLKRIKGSAPEDLRQVVDATLVERQSDGPPQ